MNEKPIILIVEKMDFLANVMEEFLKEDFECMRVDDGRQACWTVPKADIAVISSNVTSTRGFARGELVRQIKELKDLPVIALTTTQTSSARIELFNAGADDVMTKPFNPEELKVRALRLLKK